VRSAALGCCCALVSACASGCSADIGELRRISLPVAISGVSRDPTQPFEVQTALGWDVTLSAAELSVAGVYFRNAAPASGTADEQGRVTAQVLGPFTIDALDPVEQGPGMTASAVTEPVRSAELWLTEAEQGPIAAARGPLRALAHVAGVARRADQAVAFDGGLELPLQSDARGYESWMARRLRRLEADFVPDQDGRLQITVDPSHFLDAVQFDKLTAAPATETRDFAEDADQLRLLSGISKVAGYGFALAQ
jgi:hypothetical protein